MQRSGRGSTASFPSVASPGIEAGAGRKGQPTLETRAFAPRRRPPARARLRRARAARPRARSETSGESPSANTCTSGSSGSGSTCAQPRSSKTLIPSVRSSSRPLSRSVTTRITVPFIDHGQGSVSCTSARGRQVGDELRERPPDRRQQLEQLAEAGDGVVGGQELREDVAAADRAGEDDAFLRGRPGQRGERMLGPHDLQAGGLGDAVDVVRHRDRGRRPCRSGRARRGAAGRAAASARAAPPRRARRSGRGARPPGRTRRRGRRRRRRRACASGVRSSSGARPGSRPAPPLKPCAEIVSTPSGPSTSGSTYEAAE